MTAAMAAKNGWSCPSTAVAINHARLAATAVCKIGHTPTPNRPNASSTRLRTVQNPPSGTTRVSTLRFTTKHLLRIHSEPICAKHLSDINTMTLAVKGIREACEQFVIIPLLGCYFLQIRPLLGTVQGGEVSPLYRYDPSSSVRHTGSPERHRRRRPGSRLAWCPGSHQFAPRHHLHLAADVDPHPVFVPGGLQVQE